MLTIKAVHDQTFYPSQYAEPLPCDHCPATIPAGAEYVVRLNANGGIARIICASCAVKRGIARQ